MQASDERGIELKKFAVSAVLILAVLGVGSLISRYIAKTRVHAESSEKVHLGHRVDLLTLEIQDYQQVLTGFGSVHALRDATISAQVSGRILKANPEARVGASVVEGDFLYQIDPSTYEEEYARRRAILAETRTDLGRLEGELGNLRERILVVDEDLRLAQSEVDRQIELERLEITAARTKEKAQISLQVSKRMQLELQNQLIARESDVSRTKSSIKAREAEVEMARLDVEHALIRAPFSAVVAERNLEPGEFARIGSVLTRLIDISTVEIPVQIQASEVGVMTPGNAVDLRLAGREEVLWTGQVARVSPEVDPVNRTVAVYLRVDNSGLASPLLPGQLAEARIEGRVYHDVIVIPRRALIDGFAYVYVSGEARRREPKVLKALGDVAIVAAGLEQGEQLILTNLELLYEGARVHVGNHVEPERPEQTLREPPGAVGQ